MPATCTSYQWRGRCPRAVRSRNAVRWLNSATSTRRPPAASPSPRSRSDHARYACGPPPACGKQKSLRDASSKGESHWTQRLVLDMARSTSEGDWDERRRLESPVQKQRASWPSVVRTRTHPRTRRLRISPEITVAHEHTHTAEPSPMTTRGSTAASATARSPLGPPASQRSNVSQLSGRSEASQRSNVSQLSGRSEDGPMTRRQVPII
jgi:hypothetical protein